MTANLITEITKQAFSDTGPLARRINNYQPNPVQIEYAEKVASVFESGSRSKVAVGLIEAGTGIGKTLGYAIPLLAYSALTGQRVAISTHTVQLQSQLLSMGGDIDTARQVIQELTGKPLVTAPRLGLRHFVSPVRIRCAMAEKGINEGDASDSVKKFIHWADSSETGLFMEWTALNGEIPVEFSVKEVCCEHYLPPTEKSRYEKHKECAKTADVIVTNHTLTLMHALSSSKNILDDSDSRPLSILVADEADRIEAAAELLVNNSASLMSMRSLFSQQKDPSSKSILEGIQSIFDLARRFDPERETNTGKSYLSLRDNPSVLAQITAQIDKMTPLFDRAIKHCPDNEVKEEMAFTKKALSVFNARTEKGLVSVTPLIHYSDVRRLPSLRLVNPSAGTVFGLLWKNDRDTDEKSYLESVLLTSATLSDGQEHSLKSMANAMGLFKAKDYSLVTGIYEPVDFGRISLVLPDAQAPLPTVASGDDEFSTDPTWVGYIADMITEAAGSGGRVLALTLSYRDTQMIADALKGRLPETGVIIQHTGTEPVHPLLDRFKKTEGAILLSPCCWEGVNLPGLVKNLVITRIPFSPPDKVRAGMTRESMAKKGFSQQTITAAIFGQSVVHTRRKLRQAMGRGIRQKNDVSRIWLGDRRILGQHAKLRLDSCLPARFAPMLETADTFLLDGVILSPEVKEKPKTIVWGKIAYI
ncbi:MAG: ATP-dependent DNA helicase [Methylobacter sp.]|nr:ATP-dependent DNA helicase [Methylobacter sp.]